MMTSTKPSLPWEPLSPAPAKPWQPRRYQLKSVRWLLEHAAAGLFADPGLGKTSITLGALKVLKKQGLMTKTLVIAPLRVCQAVWPNEIAKWKDFEGFTYELLHGPKKAEALQRPADLYLINPEGLDWLLGSERTKVPGKPHKVSVAVDVRAFKKLGFDTLVVDELTKFKNSSNGRFKGLKHVLGTFARRWGLTGSPAANGLMGLFGQVYVLDQGQALGQYITHFRHRFYTPGIKQYEWVLKTEVSGFQKSGEDQIYEAIAPLVLRLDAKDHLELPQLVVDNIEVEMPTKAWKVYKELQTILISQLEARTVTASNAAVAAGKCRQVASGGIFYDPLLDELGLVRTDQKREHEDLHEAKTEALVDLIEGLQGSPLLVAYEFHHDEARLRRAFKAAGIEASFAKDFKKQADFLDLERRWNRGQVPVLAGHPSPISHGLNLQEAGNHVCWHTLPWDYELYDQLNRRVLRDGNKHKRVFIHHLLAKDTIDAYILDVLLGKEHGQQAFFKALKKLAKNAKLPIYKAGRHATLESVS